MGPLGLGPLGSAGVGPNRNNLALLVVAMGLKQMWHLYASHNDPAKWARARLDHLLGWRGWAGGACSTHLKDIINVMIRKVETRSLEG